MTHRETTLEVRLPDGQFFDVDLTVRTALGNVSLPVGIVALIRDLADRYGTTVSAVVTWYLARAIRAHGRPSRAEVMAFTRFLERRCKEIA